VIGIASSTVSDDDASFCPDACSFSYAILNASIPYSDFDCFSSSSLSPSLFPLV
jgi:hypothetical protein